jgi:hypothetical protein
MPRKSFCWIVLMALVYPVGLCRGRESPALPRVVANDNLTPAGQIKNGVLELKLVLSEATWFPESEGGGHRDVYVFGEEGRAPQTAGPLPLGIARMPMQTINLGCERQRMDADGRTSSPRCQIR